MQKIEWSTEKRKVKDLIPSVNNPRKMTSWQVRQLMASLEKFNYVELIAIQPDARIIAGHMRVKVLNQLGRGNEEIEVRVPNRELSDEEMREYIIRSNRNTGEWDWDILANEYDPHDLLEWGFEEGELASGALDLSDDDEATNDLEKCLTCGQKLKKKKDGSA